MKNKISLNLKKSDVLVLKQLVEDDDLLTKVFTLTDFEGVLEVRSVEDYAHIKPEELFCDRLSGLTVKVLSVNLKENYALVQEDAKSYEVSLNDFDKFFKK